MTRNNTPWEEDSVQVNDADGNLAFEVIDLVKPDKLVPTYVKGAEYSDWRKELEESWSNITTGNKVGQTFLHVPSGTTVSTGGAIGGVETVPTTLTVDGDTVAAPDITSYPIQGYAIPMGSEVLRKKKKDDTNKRLNASQKIAQKANADVMMNARVTPPIPDEPLPPGTKWELIPATYGGIVDGQWDPNYMVAPPSWTQVYIEDPDNRYKATPDGVTPKDPEPVTPKDNVGKVTKSDEKWLNNKQTLVNLTKWLGNISGGRLHTDFGQMAINYAKGDFTPITKFSPSMENEVLRVVNKKFKENPNKTTLTLSYGDWGISTGTLSLGTFKAHKLPNGDYKIEDTFNVNKTFKTVGWAGEIPFGIGKNLQQIADRIVDIAYKRRSIGGVYDEGGIPINVIIKRKRNKTNEQYSNWRGELNGN